MGTQNEQLAKQLFDLLMGDPASAYAEKLAILEKVKESVRQEIACECEAAMSKAEKLKALLA